MSIFNCYLDSTSKPIVRQCQEDRSTCIPEKKYCDKMADCPLGSDETGCNCTDLDMHECMINGARRT